MWQDNKTLWSRGLKIALVFLLVIFIFNGLFDGAERGYDRDTEHTITFSGHGEMTAVPDIANIYFTVSKDAKTIKEAQALVAEVEKKALAFLRENNISEKDMKTSNASFYPKYEYRYEAKTLLPCTQYDCPPRPGKSVIVGYTASESINVKIRNTDSAGKIIEGLGSLGVTNLGGPDFAVDNEDELKAEARRKAIADAKQKAKVLARDLGVRLGKITDFNEGSNYVGIYGKMSAFDSAVESSPASLELPKGENTITSDVTITYLIK